MRLLCRGDSKVPRPLCFVIMELESRRILHYNVTAHPTAEWTLQQFRETLVNDHAYRIVIHDRDSLFSKELDQSVADMGVRVIRTPARAPMANSICERFGGTLRRECLDFVIPLTERHLKLILKSWVNHFHHERPQMSLGPGTPVPRQSPSPENANRHNIPAGYVVLRKPILGGLHHEYSLEAAA